jgi:HEAT repeat protein
MAVLLICTFGFTLYKRKKDKNKASWTDNIATIISTAIYYAAGEDELTQVIADNRELLKKSAFRQYLVSEIIHARKDISGTSAANLKGFYEMLELNKESLVKLTHKKWHIKAKGIQELATMEQKNYVKQIFRLINHKNEFVRNEAQCALVNFHSFLGLRFLNVITYPLSEWQQIQVLHKLHGVTPQNFEPVKKWLHSKNDSVVEFALKLASFYNRYELYEDVVNCLSNKNVLVKMNAIDYLRKNPHEDTANKITSDFKFEHKMYKLSILDTLKEIGNESQVTFLLKQLHNIDNDIKAAAARAISALHPLGKDVLHNHLFADENPWKSIFLQIDNELTA